MPGTCAVIEQYVRSKVKMTFPATIQGEVMRLVKENEAKISSQDYENGIVLMVEIRKSIVNNFLDKNIRRLNVENH